MTVKRAYTLIEILIVLALISLIMAIAIPSFGIVNSIKENQEFNELKRDLLWAKNRAIVENCHYKISINIKENKYEITELITNKQIKSKCFDCGLKFIRTVDTTSDIIEFSPSGAPSRAGSFVIKNRKGQVYKWSVRPVTGKLSIYLIK